MEIKTSPRFEQVDRPGVLVRREAVLRNSGAPILARGFGRAAHSIVVKRNDAGFYRWTALGSQA